MNQSISNQSHNGSSNSSMFLEQADPPQDQGFDLAKATQDAAIYYQQNRKKTSLEKVAKQFGTTVKRVRNRVKKLNENPAFNPNNFIINAPSNPPQMQLKSQGSAATTPNGKVRKPTKKQLLQQLQQQQLAQQQQLLLQQQLQHQDIQRQQSIVQQVALANALGVVESMHQLTLDPSLIQLNGLGQPPQQLLQFQQLLLLSLLLQQQQQQQHHHLQHQQPQLPQYLQQQQQRLLQQQLLPHHGTVIDFNNLENVKLLVNNDKLTIEEIKYVINYLITKTLGQ